MIRSLKAAFGLSLMAALVFSAMSVLGASATTTGEFHANSPANKVKIDIKEATGSTHETHLNAIGTTVTCHSAVYHAHHTTNTSKFLTVTPTYTNCTQGGSEATVTMNGCHYEFTPRVTGHATAHFRCPLNVKAQVHTAAGTLSFGAQTPDNGVIYDAKLENGKKTITATITATGIDYTCHGACQIFGTTGTNATLTGSATVSGTDTDTGNAIDVWVE
jgi:hypothetical protein